MPVKFLISPRRAFSYRPLGSRRLQTSRSHFTNTLKKRPCGSNERAKSQSRWNGEMKLHKAILPCAARLFNRGRIIARNRPSLNNNESYFGDRNLAKFEGYTPVGGKFMVLRLEWKEAGRIGRAGRYRPATGCPRFTVCFVHWCDNRYCAANLRHY